MRALRERGNDQHGEATQGQAGNSDEVGIFDQRQQKLGHQVLVFGHNQEVERHQRA